MNCRFCGANPDCVVLLNVSGGGPFSCISCARANGVYCELHRIGHSEYWPIGTTCRSCIDETIKKNLHRGPNFLRQIYKALPEDITIELNDLFDYDPAVASFAWRSRRLIQELSLHACCRHVSLQAIVNEICETKSIRPIFP